MTINVYFLKKIDFDNILLKLTPKGQNKKSFKKLVALSLKWRPGVTYRYRYLCLKKSAVPILDRFEY